MGLADKVRAWLRRERTEAADALAAAERRLDADLSRRERELQATPEEKLDLLQERINDNDAELDAIRDRLQRRSTGDDPGSD